MKLVLMKTRSANGLIIATPPENSYNQDRAACLHSSVSKGNCPCLNRAKPILLMWLACIVS
jgi:hypothetical protein